MAVFVLQCHHDDEQHHVELVHNMYTQSCIFIHLVYMNSNGMYVVICYNMMRNIKPMLYKVGRLMQMNRYTMSCVYVCVTYRSFIHGT